MSEKTRHPNDEARPPEPATDQPTNARAELAPLFTAALSVFDEELAQREGLAEHLSTFITGAVKLHTLDQTDDLLLTISVPPATSSAWEDQLRQLSAFLAAPERRVYVVALPPGVTLNPASLTAALKASGWRPPRRRPWRRRQ